MSSECAIIHCQFMNCLLVYFVPLIQRIRKLLGLDFPSTYILP